MCAMCVNNLGVLGGLGREDRTFERLRVRFVRLIACALVGSATKRIEYGRGEKSLLL